VPDDPVSVAEAENATPPTTPPLDLSHIERWRAEQTGEPPWRAYWREVAAKRRARRKAGGPMTMTTREVAERDGWVCAWARVGDCLVGWLIDPTLDGNDRVGPTLEHLIPLSQGGSNDPANLGVSHRICNVSHQGRGRDDLAA
jgi:hypothetical protein